MDFFYALDISVPLSQIAVLLLLSTLALLYGRAKLALLINYVFTVYWGYFLNRDFMSNSAGVTEMFSLIYFGFGIGIILLAMLGFLVQGKQ